MAIREIKLFLTTDERILRLKRKIEAVMFGKESIPDSMYGGKKGGDIACDIHVNDENVQCVRIYLKETYEALLAVDSAESLKEFKDLYTDGFYGAANQLPYVSDMLDELEEKYAA